MPYFITEGQDDCAGWATVKEEDDGSLTTIGCHESKQDAIDQMVAVSIAEDMAPGGERNLNGPAAIIVDIDGTLITNTGQPMPDTISFVDNFDGEVIIVTARAESERDATIAELDSFDIEYDQLFMKPNRSDDSVDYKSNVAKDLLDVYNIVLAIENDPDIRAEYERLGLDVMTPGELDTAQRDLRQVDLTLPQYIRDAAARGLELLADGYGGDGLVDRTIREARLMANGEISEDKIIRVAAWAARHLVDLEAEQNTNPRHEDWPGNGAVAFYLWGIDPTDPEPAIAWFEGKRDEIIAEEEQDAMRSWGSVSVRDRPGATLFRMTSGVEQRRITINEFEVRDATSGDGSTFVGLAAAFNAPSQPLPFIERIAPGAFARSLRSRNEIKLFVNHDTSRVLASKRAGTLRLWESDRGLEVEADLPDTTDGRDMSILLKRGDIDSMSFGFSVPKGGDVWSDNGQERELREVRLHEVSIVTGFPAYEQTAASVRSLDGLVDATGIEAEDLSAAITALEKGETLDEHLAGILDQAVTKLRAS
ncbi:MAG: HK97 family phage prohead protease, partial [Ilumatobacteraceae bacterium]